jgi:hypothetical protein
MLQLSGSIPASFCKHPGSFLVLQANCCDMFPWFSSISLGEFLDSALKIQVLHYFPILYLWSSSSFVLGS